MKQKRLISPIIGAVVFLALITIPNIVRLSADWPWFKELGFENIFITILSAKIVLGFLVGAATFGLIYLNLKISEHLTRDLPAMMRFGERDGEQIDIRKYINILILPLALTLGFFTGLFAAGNWEIFLQYFNIVRFGTVDPIFNRDISFYFFTLPFIKILIGFGFWIIILSLIGALLNYFVRGVISFERQNLWIERRVKIHLSVLLFLFFLLLAIQTYFVKIPNLLYSTTGPFLGASFTDIHAVLPFLKVLTIILFAGAVLTIVNIYREKNQLIFIVIGLYFITSVIGTWLYPAIIQKLIVLPNELQKEAPYITHNITATRKAFALNKVKEGDLKGETALTLKDIQSNEATIKNVRLWDRKPLLDTFGQLQEIRTYYDFVSVDNDRYMIDGEYRQIMLSPRELNSMNLPHRTFINEQLTFTHGFGLTLGPVNQVTEEGLPVLFLKDLPPVSSTKSIEVKRPEIYFGELSSDYVFVKTKSKEFNYPKGEENVFTAYEGEGGVEIKSLLRKALFALRFGSFKILLSNDITNESRILFYRNIRERAKRALPFLYFDSDPYLVITREGRLKWIYDAYTINNRYPYAQMVDSTIFQENIRQANSLQNSNLNYIRNSVKIVIDAYDGKIQAYITQEDDPMIKVYAKIFKGVFLPFEAMPQDIREHVRYPEDIFKIQTSLYTTYHMKEPQIFYNKEDQWEIPAVTSEGETDPIMRHMIMKLPGEEKEEFILMIPFTPRKKNNLAAWMVARSDGQHYGELAVYCFPKQKLIFGPGQIVNRINQDAEISRQISLWDQRGSRVNLGNLLVIPIEESLLYVQPLYLRAEGGKIPELKRVIVAYENHVAMEKTLEIALERIFGKEPPEVSSKEVEISEEVGARFIEPKEEEENLAGRAKEYFDRALQAQRDGNWALYGEQLRKLGEVLDELNKPE